MAMSSLYHCKIPSYFHISLPPPSAAPSSTEVSFLHHFPISPQSTKFLAPRCCSRNPNFFPSSPRPAAAAGRKKKKILPRDRFINFGRHKGKMLGSLPSSYLQWVSKELKGTQFNDWALLADQVLNDPLYRDRIEWEHVQRFMNGEDGRGMVREDFWDYDTVTELREIADKFDWDMDDRIGWRTVHFALLGTSEGGRIPRKKDRGGGEEKQWRRPTTREEFSKASDKEEAAAAAVVGERRRERRERRMLKSERDLGVGLKSGEERVAAERDGEVGGGTPEEESGSDSDGDDDQVVLGKSKYPTLKSKYLTVEKGGRFPGRESLLKKVINHRKRSP